MTEIEVSRVPDAQAPMRFHVRLTDDDGSSTGHNVTLSRADHERLGDSYETPEALIRASFEFLLGREPKESILRLFDLSEIAIYFPEFEEEIALS